MLEISETAGEGLHGLFPSSERTNPFDLGSEIASQKIMTTACVFLPVNCITLFTEFS